MVRLKPSRPQAPPGSGPNNRASITPIVKGEFPDQSLVIRDTEHSVIGHVSEGYCSPTRRQEAASFSPPPPAVLGGDSQTTTQESTIGRKRNNSDCSFSRYDDFGTLEPKAWVPHNRQRGQTPRGVIIERLRRQYMQTDIGPLVSTELHQLSISDALSPLESFLKLEDFDDAEYYEAHPPERWIELGKCQKKGGVAIPAMAQRMKGTAAGQWSECIVTSYDPVQRHFKVIFKDPTLEPLEESLPRLKIWFRVEDPVLFAQRLARAHKLRHETLQNLHYSLSVDCMPLEGMPDIGMNQRQRLRRKVNIPEKGDGKSSSQGQTPYQENLLKNLLVEISRAYQRTLNKLAFDSHALVSGNPDFLSVIARHCKDPLSSSYGHPRMDSLQLSPAAVREKKTSFLTETCLTTAEVIAVLVSTLAECDRTASKKLLIVKPGRAARLKEFAQQQEVTISSAAEYLEGVWVQEVVKAIEGGLAPVQKGWFHMGQSDFDSYQYSKLKKLFIRIRLMMQSALRTATLTSLSEFCGLFEPYDSSTVEVRSINEVIIRSCRKTPYGRTLEVSGDSKTMKEVNGADGLHLHPPTFYVDLVISKDKAIINEAEMLQRNKEIEAWYTEHKKVGGSSSDPCPLSPLSPREGYGFTYNTELQKFEESLLRVFDSALKSTFKVKNPEQYAMKHFFWSSHPSLTPVSFEEESIQACRNGLARRMREYTAPLMQYLTMFNKHVETLSLDTKEHVLQYVSAGGTSSSAPFSKSLSTEASEAASTGEAAADLEAEKVAAGVAARGLIDDPSVPLPPHHLLQIETEIRNRLKLARAADEEIPRNLVNFGMIAVNCAEVRGVLLKKHLEVAHQLQDFLLRRARAVRNQSEAKYLKVIDTLSKTPGDVEQLTALVEYISATVPHELQALKEREDEAERCLQSLWNFHFIVPEEDARKLLERKSFPLRIGRKVERTRLVIEELRSNFSTIVQEDSVLMMDALQSLDNEIQVVSRYKDIRNIDQIRLHVDVLEKKIKKFEEERALHNSREELLSLTLSRFELLDTLKKSLEPYTLLWVTTSNFLRRQSSWMDGQFLSLSPDAMEKELESLWMGAQKASKYFEKAQNVDCSAIATEIKTRILAFKEHLPLITALRTPGLGLRHWEALGAQIGKPIAPNEKNSLADMLNMNLAEHLTLISKVAETANKEYQIEKALDEIEKGLSLLSLQVVPYRETQTFILRAVEEVLADLGEKLTMVQTLQFSPFKKPYEEKIERWSVSLSLISEVLEEWMAVQRSWLYLQPIFDSPEIIKQLPTESKRFSTVDKTYRNMLSQAHSKPSVLKVCDNERLLQKLKESNRMLESVQKGLSDYLETKRAAFSRFYFLANEELLSLLSEGRDVQRVQPHLKKCFEGLVKVLCRADGTISAMISAEEETVPLSSPIETKGRAVEIWMGDLEQSMREAVREAMKAAILDYEATPRTKWIQRWPGMCVLNASQTHWTRQMEEAITSAGPTGIKAQLDLQLAQLADMVRLVRSNISGQTRTTLGALTVLDVHARDVTASLLQEGDGEKGGGVKDVADFNWISQLRYYWVREKEGQGEGKDDGNLWAEMVSARRPYGYEYLGNSMRLVITPLTDKCYMTLLAALQMTLGGAPAGPAGTGKTESTKDLAKALAKQCVVFNCSDGLDYIAMGKFFKGLASCGAWACFDEFNRIDVEVLSVVGQQVITIQMGIRRGEKRLIFEGSDIPLNDQFGVFITMNPGYAGRSELPDSLAALFRPVAMMVPDYALIGEILFFAFGFGRARECGQKMVSTFKLCSEQLSAQFHYDYGMRAVKTTITAAGNLKRQNPEMDEEALLLRALQDVNLPKFLAQDLPLFQGILADLFPGLERPPSDLMALHRAVGLQCEREGLLSPPSFLSKVVQLYETLCVRHGIMLVGPTGGGKSTNINILAQALTELKSAEQKGFAFERVIRYQLNPKSITLGQLYGEFDPSTHEWQDGILSTLYREAAFSSSLERKWLILDGPVDAIWIESMNTVLDDNKKLCLNSGEMLKMTETMTMIFEVDDLSMASPATVSRAGMVYMEPAALGLDVLIQSWIQRWSQHITYGTRAQLQFLFDSLLSPCLTFLRGNMKEPVPSVDNNLTQSLTRILDCYLHILLPKDGVNAEVLQEERKKVGRGVGGLFIFALLWSVGATTDSAGRRRFDAFLRAEVGSFLCNGKQEHHAIDGGGIQEREGLYLPKTGLLYDYHFDLQGNQWVPWMDTIPSFSVAQGERQLAEVIVPTQDSVRHTFLINLLLNNGKHIMVIGPTGTGKTVTIAKYLQQGLGETSLPISLSFSAQTSANQTQDLLDSKMEKRKKGVFGPPTGKKYIIFIDDLNMPKREKYLAQPPLELLRQWFDQSGWYDRKTLTFKSIVDLQFITAMGPPGGGRNPISGRLVRQFNLLSVTELEDESKQKIFSTILGTFLGAWGNEEISSMCQPLVISSIDLYNTITRELLPTPSRPHYTFNLRDLAKVLQGLLMGERGTIRSPLALLRLWVHESCRVFGDRLVNEEDNNWFLSLLRQVVDGRAFKHISLQEDEDVGISDVTGTGGNNEQACLWEAVMKGNKRLIYGDFMHPGAEPKLYQEIPDHSALSSILQEYLSDFNATSRTPMPLVLFLDAMEHVSRVSRVLRQERGHALLLGVGGSGRQSLAKLATSIAEYTCFQVEISKGYGMKEWREDVKRCLMTAGLQGRQTVFLFSDVQVIDETMLEDLNSILNSGDVPNLYKDEDLEQIFSALRGECQRLALPPTKLTLFSLFLQKVRRNMHVVLCMSPIGDSFRRRLRMFPSLVNCCTIDWFREWPEEALHSVAMSAFSPSSDKEERGTGEGVGEHLPSLVAFFQVAHQSVESKSRLFFQHLRRHNYVTPTSYLELLQTFKAIFKGRKEELQGACGRLQNGVDKIKSTKLQVASMQEQLIALKPELERTQAEVEQMVQIIAKDKEAADRMKAEVEKEETTANTKAAMAQAIKDDAQKDLDQALPALDEAVKCLNMLKKSDIDEVKALKTPPGGVKLTMEAACIIFGIKPTKKADPNKPGQKITDYWEAAQRSLLLDPKGFMNSMLTFDKDNIPEAVIAEIEPYIQDQNFTPDAIQKASKACTAICMWVRAMYTYNRVAVAVEPKRRALKAAEDDLKESEQALSLAKAKLQDVTNRLEELESKFQEGESKKEKLAADCKQCETRLDSALKLIALLGGEEVRWGETVERLQQSIGNLPGDVAVAAATVSYLGAFTYEYREECVKEWQGKLLHLGLPHTANCSILSTLADPVRVRAWQLAGLPSDALSVQNGIIMSRARRWPLLVDPQGQANRFIKNLGKDSAESGLEVIKLSDKNFLRTLENGVRFGKWILLENIGEELDAALEPVLLQQKYRQGGQLMMRLGEASVPYNDGFKFFMTTKLPNPHYPPEICVKVSLLNFTITPKGLEDQALGVVVQEELPELAERKSTLTVNSARMRAELVDIENKILQMLANSKGNVLDDTELISTLGKAKVTSENISTKMAEAEETERTIDETRETYRAVAARASLLYFCISDLAMVDPMYQYSLTWFIELFIKGIRSAEKSLDVKQRLQNLLHYVTYSLYKNICRSLFEKHKLLFSFLLCIKILQGQNRINSEHWRFLLSGMSSSASKAESLVNPAPDWIDKRAWDELCALSTIPPFTDLGSAITSNLNDWQLLIQQAEMQRHRFPSPYEARLNNFEKLLIIRCLRPDKVTEAIQDFVAAEMGNKFIEPPPFDLGGAFMDSSPSSPLIFVLSPGSDPAKDLLSYAEEMKMSKKVLSISLGQGQGPLANNMIHEGRQEGKWVLLQNCHLATSWMPELERIVEELDPKTVHKDFRLWLTSLPSKAFPSSVLQSGVKMTKEPPKGLRANLKATYLKLDEKKLERTSKPEIYKKLVFALSFFHANILERRKFGPLGWNIPYQFNETDFDISLSQLEMFLDKYDEIPFRVLKVMTSVVNYGGRVTDDKDMRTIDVILSDFFCKEVLEEGYAFSKSGTYRSYSPESGKSAWKSYLSYIDSLPINAEPEVFGMHENANVTCAIAETYGLFDTLLSLQPRVTGGEGKSREEIIEETVRDMQERLPELFNLEAISMQYPTRYEESMNTVLLQEAGRFNTLLHLLKASLPELRKALKGLVLMSAELEAMATSIYTQKVPAEWESRAYPSLKPLPAWFNDLLDRVGFLSTWVKSGVPDVFWISGFFFPQSFLTGTLQNHARREKIPIDLLSFGFQFKESVAGKPDRGCYIKGLYIEGARWDPEKRSLVDPKPKELFAPMPVIHLIPEPNRLAPKSGVYRCPVYKILTRTGSLSTTGHSTNFIFWLEIPSDRRSIQRQALVSETNAIVKVSDQDYWIKAGVACFCSLIY